MKGNPRVIDALNRAIVSEWQALQQYFVSSRIAKRRGFHKAAENFHQDAIDELDHVGRLMDRVLFLGGEPKVGVEVNVQIKTEIPDQLEVALDLELQAVQIYSDLIDVSEQVGDYGSRDLATEILEDEESHVILLEARLDLIETIGVENYLQTQM